MKTEEKTLEYPLEKGYYRNKESGEELYVLAEEDGLVHCERKSKRFALLAVRFITRYEKLI